MLMPNEFTRRVRDAIRSIPRGKVASYGQVAADLDRNDHREFPLERGDQLADLEDLARVEADRRLVQYQDLGIVDRSLGDADTVLGAARNFLDQAALDGLDASRHHGLGHGFLVLDGGDLLDRGDEDQVRRLGHVWVEGQDFRQIDEDLLELVRLVEDVVISDRGFAFRGGQVAAKMRLVIFPAALGLRKPQILSFSTWNLRPRTAVRSPYFWRCA